MNPSSYSFDAELDAGLVRKVLSSPLCTQEREEPANLRQTYHSHEESLLPAQSFSTRTSTERPVYEPSSDLSQKRKSSRDLENERIRFSLKDKKSKFLLKSDLTSRSTNFKPMARRWGPQGRSATGVGGLARVPNLRVCKPLGRGVGHAGEKDELTSCRSTV